MSHLSVGGSNLDSDDIEDLASSPYLESLTHLALPANEVGTRGALAAMAMPNLRSLSLVRNRLGPVGF